MQPQSNQSFSQREKQSNKNLALYTGTWLITTALLAFGPTLLWSETAGLTVLAIVLNLIAGFFMIKANIHHLKNLDELGQKIFLESAAITLGVLMVVGVCYELVFLSEHLFEFTPRISHLYFVMGTTFIAATYIGHRRYR